jgi:signal transduction histidine kinase
MAHASDTALRRWSLALFGATIALSLVYIVCARAIEGDPGLTYSPNSGQLEESEVIGVLTAALIGLLLTWLRPRNPIGWWVAASGLVLAASDAGQHYGALAVLGDDGLPLGSLAMALAAPLWIPAVAIAPTVLLARYPSGRIHGTWVRRFDRVAIGGYALLYVGYATSDPAVQDMVKEADSPFDFVPDPVLFGIGIISAVGGVALLISAIVIAGDGLRRLIRAEDRGERMALTLFWGAAVIATLTAFFSPYEWMLSIAWWGVLIAVAVGVLRYQAMGVQVTVLTGDARDPFAALSRLGSPLGGDMDEHSLTGVLAALREALEVDGVAVEGPVAAASGSLTAEPTRLPLQFAGAEVGVLLVGARPGGTPLGRSGQRVLEAVAPLIAAVIHAVQVAEELRGQQERVVAATQAERVRLRQELHDGLGPALTGIGLGLEALSTRVPEGGEELVTRLRSEVAGSLEETRRIIDDLRPSALDDGDLAAALRRRTDQLRTSGLDVEVEIDEGLPPLPAATVAATFRIAEEALTNVVRHSGAGHVRLTLQHVDDSVRLEVVDDGRGPGVEREGGVGIGSMRDRAERLGGSFEIEPAQPGTPRPGTVVRVALPLVVAAP